jgi:LysR family cys regulon transcriptional activator
MYDFMRLFAPHLTRRLVEQALRAATPEESAALFEPIKLPRY